MPYKKLWIALGVVMLVSFAVLGSVGYKAISSAPPIPGKVVTVNGELLFTAETIRDGQNVWQSTGGQEIGTIWGHGAYVAPDWSADYLHRQSEIVLNRWAQQQGAADYATMPAEGRAGLQGRLTELTRRNTYDSTSDTIVLDEDRAAAFRELAAYYADVYGKGRNEYAIPAGALVDTAKQRQMAAFFWWTAWAASTNRPGTAISYTQNWPHEELIGNRPTGAAIVWSVISFVLLLAGVGGMVWYFASQEHVRSPGGTPRRDPLLGLQPTPSQKATIKYFFVVAALWLVQVALGAIVAHYAVEGGGFYGIPLAKWLPYSVARTWHLQIGIFWIATSWLATGHCSCSQWRRTKRAAARRERTVCRFSRGRCRLARWRVDGHRAKAGQSLVLVWRPGLRICGSGPRLADSVVRWVVVLVMAHVARPETCAGSA
jgi:nitric oxide reductase subunit B